MTSNGDSGDWAAMESELMKEDATGASDTPQTATRKKERHKHLKKLGVTKLHEGKLPSLEQRRMSEDVDSEGRRGSTDSAVELDAEMKKAKSQYLADSDDTLSTDSDRRPSDSDRRPSDGEGEDGAPVKKPKKSVSKKTMNATLGVNPIKKSASKPSVSAEVITVGTLPTPPPPISPSLTIKVPKAKKAKEDDAAASPDEDPLNTENKDAKRRSLNRVKSMKEKGFGARLSRGTLDGPTRKLVSKSPDLGAPPPLMLPPEPLATPPETPPKAAAPASPKSARSAKGAPPGSPSSAAAGDPAAAAALPPALPPPPLADIDMSLLAALPALPPPPPPIHEGDDDESDEGDYDEPAASADADLPKPEEAGSAANTPASSPGVAPHTLAKRKSLKRRKSTGSLSKEKKIIKKDKDAAGGEEVSKVQPNAKRRPRMMDHAIRVVPSMFDEAKSIEKEIFAFDQRETTEIILYLGDEEDDTEDYNLEYPAIKSAVVEKLVTGLTPENYTDPDYTFTFLLNYRQFLTPERLLKFLEMRWNLPTPTKGKVDADTFDKKKRKPIRLRIFNVMKLWIDEHYRDLEIDKNAFALVEKFVSSVISKDMAGPSSQLLRLLKERPEIKTIDELQFDQKPPKPYLPMNLRGKLSVLDLHPEEVARQITLIDHGLFRLISPREFLNTAWMKGDKELRAPGILNMINNFNKISRWVATEIVQQTDLKQRALVLLRFICIAHFFLELNNYNGVMSVIAALQNSAIHRLYKTWELLPQKAFEMFESMALLMNGNAGEGNFFAYRERLKKVVPPVVPYLGVFLTDMTFLHEGNQDFVDDQKRMVNFNKMAKIGRVVRTIMTYQQTPYCLAAVDFIREYILKAETLAEDDQYKESIKIEEKVPKAQRNQPAAKDKKKIKPVEFDFKAVNIDVEGKDKK